MREGLDGVTALWGDFLNVPDLSEDSKVMYYDRRTGETGTAFEDGGYGALWYLDGRFYSAAPGKNADENYSGQSLHRCWPDGSGMDDISEGNYASVTGASEKNDYLSIHQYVSGQEQYLVYDGSVYPVQLIEPENDEYFVYAGFAGEDLILVSRTGDRYPVSEINLETGEKDTYTSDKLYNPTKIAVAGSDIYVLDMGNYADVKAEVKKMNVSKNKLSVTVQSVMDATAVCFMGTKIYGINSPYGATEATYEVYDIRTAQKTTFTNDGVVSPVLIEADPVNNKVYIASYQIDTATGYPAYSSNAYIAEYAADGSKLNEYECGVGPNAIVFNTRVEYIKFND